MKTLIVSMAVMLGSLAPQTFPVEGAASFEVPNSDSVAAAPMGIASKLCFVLPALCFKR